MTKAKGSAPGDDMQARIAALAALGIAVEAMGSHRGWWKVCAAGTTFPHRLTRFHGYPTQADAVKDAELVTEKLRRYRAETDLARRDYQIAVGYTHVTPKKLTELEAATVAAYEYERIEAVRLGLPLRR